MLDGFVVFRIHDLLAAKSVYKEGRPARPIHTTTRLTSNFISKHTSIFSSVLNTMALAPSQSLVLAGVIGITSSTAFVFTNVTTSVLLLQAIILPPKSQENETAKDVGAHQSAWHLARQWSKFEAWAHKISIAALVVGISSFIYAAQHSPASSSQRLLWYTSAGFDFAAIPFTIIFTVRKNNELEQRSRSGKKMDLKETETRHLIDQVSFVGKIRVSLPLVSVVLGVLALIA